LIPGLQQVTGKILSHNELVVREHRFARDIASIGHLDFSVKVG
jgi:hypothetical protein